MPNMNNNQPTALPPEINQFKKASIDVPGISAADLIELLNHYRIQDIQQKISLRPRVYKFYKRLLIVQNLSIFGLVVYAFRHNLLNDLQLIFSALVTASLLQTYGVLKLITDKLFSDIDYSEKTPKST